MSAPRGMRKVRKTADVERMFDRMSVSYCPECGTASQILDPPAMVEMAKEGESVSFGCPQCGEFSVTRKGRGWVVKDTDIPYIMNAETDAATRLYRFDPSCSRDADEAALLHMSLLCETALQYASVGDDESASEYEGRAVDEILRCLEKGVKDEGGQMFACLHVFFTMAYDGLIDDSRVPEVVSAVSDRFGLFDPLMASGILNQCVEAVLSADGEMPPALLESFESMIENDPGEPQEPDDPRRRVYWETLVMTAAMLGRTEDTDRLLDRTVAEWKDQASREDADMGMMEMTLMFVSAVSDLLEPGSYERMMDGALEVAQMRPDRFTYMEPLVRIDRYEYRMVNGQRPFDREEDLDWVIEHFSQPANDSEASLAVKAMAHKAIGSEDIDEDAEYMDRAFDMIREFRLQDASANLVMDIGVEYLSLADGDQKLTRTALAKMKKVGITKDMLKKWKKGN